MLEAGLAQLRLAASLLFGVRFSLRSFDCMIAALKETQREFGSVGQDGQELLSGPTLDEETRREVQLRRFRAQARRAARETAYYKRLFARLGLDLRLLTYEDIAALPLTPKVDLRQDPDAFVSRAARPYLRALTTGTTGWPTSVSFSSYELRVHSALTAIASLMNGDLLAEDIVQISTSARGTLGNVCLAGACAHIGAQTYLAGMIEPASALALLTEKRQTYGKKARTSVLYTYPSYLGELVEYGLAHGYRPADFGLERIFVGGETLTEGLKARSQQLFGDAHVIESAYGMTEIWPFGGQPCEAGHLHYEISQGLVEVVDPETGAEAKPGEVGVIIATPFYPYRETTLLLRYETGDIARVPLGPLTCRLRNLPATERLLGKRDLVVRHEDGWTYPRQIAEALEALDQVPLPARYGCWAIPGGVAVEVVVREATAETRRRVATSLEARGVPVRELHLCVRRDQLQCPIPLRGDLREAVFSQRRGVGTQMGAAISV
jgi:phenylacetate-coenzyme A ligase PaaK-like adenylate-forming protein